MKIDELYEKIVLNKLNISEFINIVVILAVKEDKLRSFLVIMPELKKAIDRLIDINILVKSNNTYKINEHRYINTKYYKVLENTDIKYNFTSLFSELSKKWRGKIGITDNGGRYTLYDKQKAQRALVKFLEENDNIDVDILLKANEEFLENTTVDKRGYLRYAPKFSTFISGNEKNSYLIEYYYNILERNKLGKEVINESKSIDGFSKDL